MADLSRCFLFMSAFRDKCLGDETGAKKKKKKQKKKKKSGATEAAQDPLAKVWVHSFPKKGNFQRLYLS